MAESFSSSGISGLKHSMLTATGSAGSTKVNQPNGYSPLNFSDCIASNGPSFAVCIARTTAGWPAVFARTAKNECGRSIAL